MATRAHVARDHHGYADKYPARLGLTALRTKSVHAREILTDFARPWHTPAELDAWADSGDPWPDLPDDVAVRWLGRYTEVLAVQTGDPAETRRARRMLESAFASERASELRSLSIEMLLHLRIAERDHQGAADLVGHPILRKRIAAAARTDLLNPWVFAEGDEEQWLAALNTTLHSPRVADLALRPVESAATDRPFDRLYAPHAVPVAAPYLVTVMMSTYRPGPELWTAVRSVMEQTWGNLELFLVDDASGPQFEPLLRAVAATDPRIRLVRKAVNGGTYRARNTALRLASGAFAAVADSDDYLHPQALEISVRALVGSDTGVAVRSEAVRVPTTLELNRPGYLPRVPSGPSLVYRLPEVTARVGFFDPTTRSADTEFLTRLTAAFGSEAVIEIVETLGLLRAGETLSSGDFSRGWRHPARHAYRGDYRRWHDAIKSDVADAFLDPDAPRRFPEPRRWARPGDPSLARSRHIDLCVAGDWRFDGGPQKSMLQEIRAALAAGHRVAVMHLESVRFMLDKDIPLSTAMLDLLAGGEVERIHPDDDVDIEVLMVRYPPILQYPPVVPDAVRPRQVLIVANQAPTQPDGTEQRYVVGDVTERTIELFGTSPLWVPQSPRIRRLLLEQDPGVPLTSWDSPALIDAATARVRPARAPGADGAPIIVGRHSRENYMKFAPTLAEIERGYAFPDPYRVRMMGGQYTIGELRKALGRDPRDGPANWELLPVDTLPVPEFLAELDFFLYLDNPGTEEAFGRVLLEAAAAGVLTIAHPKHRENFGDLLDYADTGEAQDLIAAYVADPDAYAARVERTLALVRERFDHAAFVRHLADQGLHPPDPHASEDAAGSGAAVGAARVGVGIGADGAPVLLAEPPVTVRTVPLRAAADAERADRLDVIHGPGAGPRVQAWLSESLHRYAEESLDQALFDSVPVGVEALLLQRDGLALLTTRGPLPDGAGGRGGGDSGTATAAAAPLRTPAAWARAAWWAGPGA